MVSRPDPLNFTAETAAQLQRRWLHNDDVARLELTEALEDLVNLHRAREQTRRIIGQAAADWAPGKVALAELEELFPPKPPAKAAAPARRRGRQP